MFKKLLKLTINNSNKFWWLLIMLITIVIVKNNNIIVWQIIVSILNKMPQEILIVLQDLKIMEFEIKWA